MNIEKLKGQMDFYDSQMTAVSTDMENLRNSLRDRVTGISARILSGFTERLAKLEFEYETYRAKWEAVKQIVDSES